MEKPGKEDSKMGHMKKLGRKTSTFACRIRDHVKLSPKLSQTVKGKLRLGARIIQEGGRENIFKHIFGVTEGEELLKASQCYLSTTAGPIAGLLFISTQKVAFCSEAMVTLNSPNGDLIRIPYKVVIPVKKIKRANKRENVHKPTQKYIEIVTEDDFEFWFMGFLRYEKALENLEIAISMLNSPCKSS
ncbi:GEM-like protein 4 isoform X2 [Jatropha curcas]|uniref:GEM-like protein 4 isoform X2 n=1 Tax=Jatropha curcas TaxID=180498 RepID=UPI0005FB2C21|nr:GEM-like protein 4 isoform X2 [Jatropha curcas]